MENLANFLPLMVASRILRDYNKVSNDEYLSLLKAIESFSYRVYLWERKRSNSGQTHFYRWADEVYSLKYPINSVTERIYNEINWFSPEDSFRKSLKEEFFYWYQNRRLLKYTLFEYELFLLAGKNQPKLKWNEVSDSTIEHILPQNPSKDSKWLLKWTDEDRQKFLHDIGNLVLTKDNSRYSNFEFERKKGIAGTGYCYSNSDIRQERNIAEFDDWTPLNLAKRREHITNWIVENWGIDNHLQQPIVEIVEDEEGFILDDIDL